MHGFHSYTKTITVSALGAATVYFGSAITGKVLAIKYAPGTLDTGATLTLTGETTGVPIFVKANAGTDTVWYFPRTLVNSRADGVASTDDFDHIHIFEERIKLVVAAGGDSLVGSMTVYTEENEGYWSHS